ncbi:MAG TPA: sigma-54 dependent transcriptional regulator, partial [Nitrospinota bacterium]|nr:sigma-54 dependent transcriptional regulator [Nitrospinota bacterium]
KRVLMSKELLIVEDDQTMLETLSHVFRKAGFTVFEAGNGAAGIEVINNKPVKVMLLDLNLPDMSGLDVLARVKEIDDQVLCIFMTAYPEIKTAVTAMKQGAYDYINKPFELDELRIIVNKAFEVETLKSEIASLRYERDSRRQDFGMVGNSDPIKRIQDQISQVARTDNTHVLILGESGTGKELVADAIHNISSRKDKPLLKINCSSIPETLLESELFGHAKGAFTDAKTSKAGIFELSHTGTIFLDEIGDLAISLQPKLLRVLESRSLRKLGGTKDIAIDIRVISATNQELSVKIQQNQFRSDLLYRLNVFTILVPPLRERVHDIPHLARHFLSQFKSTMKEDVIDFDNDAIELLKNYAWPGNIRELKNMIERAYILTKTNIITRKDLLPDSGFNLVKNNSAELFSIRDNWTSLEEVEAKYIQSVVNHFDGNKSEAARLLGISRVTLREKLKKCADADFN